MVHKASESLAFGSVPRQKFLATSQSTCLWPTRLCQGAILENGSVRRDAVLVLDQIAVRVLLECLLMQMGRLLGRPISIGMNSCTRCGRDNEQLVTLCYERSMRRLVILSRLSSGLCIASVAALDRKYLAEAASLVAIGLSRL